MTYSSRWPKPQSYTGLVVSILLLSVATLVLIYVYRERIVQRSERTRTSLSKGSKKTRRRFSKTSKETKRRITLLKDKASAYMNDILDEIAEEFDYQQQLSELDMREYSSSNNDSKLSFGSNSNDKSDKNIQERDRRVSTYGQRRQSVRLTRTESL